jgi:hypothetical protein
MAGDFATVFFVFFKLFSWRACNLGGKIIELLRGARTVTDLSVGWWALLSLQERGRVGTSLNSLREGNKLLFQPVLSIEHFKQGGFS